MIPPWKKRQCDLQVSLMITDPAVCSRAGAATAAMEREEITDDQVEALAVLDADYIHDLAELNARYCEKWDSIMAGALR